MPSSNITMFDPAIETYLKSIHKEATSKNQIFSNSASVPLPEFEETLDNFKLYMRNQALPLHLTAAMVAPHEFVTSQFRLFLEQMTHRDSFEGATPLNASMIEISKFGPRLLIAGKHFYIGTKLSNIPKLSKDANFLGATIYNEENPDEISNFIVTKSEDPDRKSKQPNHKLVSNFGNGIQAWMIRKNSQLVIDGIALYLNSDSRIEFFSEQSEPLGSFIYTGLLQEVLAPSQMQHKYLDYHRTVISDLVTLGKATQPDRARIERLHTFATELSAISEFIFDKDETSKHLHKLWKQTDFFRFYFGILFHTSSEERMREMIEKDWKAFSPLQYHKDIFPLEHSPFSSQTTIKNIPYGSTAPEEIQPRRAIEILAILDVIYEVASIYGDYDNPIAISIKFEDEQFKVKLRLPHEISLDFPSLHTKVESYYTYDGFQIKITHPLKLENEETELATNLYGFNPKEELFEFTGGTIPMDWYHLNEEQKLTVLLVLSGSLHITDQAKRIDYAIRTIKKVLKGEFSPRGIYPKWDTIPHAQKKAVLRHIIRTAQTTAGNKTTINVSNIANVIQSTSILRNSTILIGR